MAATLTTANSSIAVTIEALFPSGVLLQGYAADNVFEAAEVQNAEVSMGIDGNLSSGFVFNPLPLTITLQADSPSLRVFEEVWKREVSTRNKLAIGLTISLPANGKRYTYKNGIMNSYKAPAGQRILQPAVVQFTFGRMEPSEL